MKSDLQLARVDFLILGSLKTNEAVKPMFGLTIKEMGITEVGRSCIWVHLDKLIKHELVCQYGTYKNQKMYYITQKGLELLKGEMNTV